MSLGGQLGNPLGRTAASGKGGFDLSRANLLKVDVAEGDSVGGTGASGSFIAPAGTTQMRLSLWNWGGYSAHTLTGGGGSANVQDTITASPGDVVDYVIPAAIGAAGSRPANSTAAVNGKPLLSAQAGQNSVGTGSPGAAGLSVNSIGTRKFSGAPGTYQNTASPSAEGTAAGNAVANDGNGTGGAAGGVGPFPGGNATKTAARSNSPGAGTTNNAASWGGAGRLIVEYYGDPL